MRVLTLEQLNERERRKRLRSKRAPDRLDVFRDLRRALAADEKQRQRKSKKKGRP
jgi:hypothetical protein